MIAFLGCGRGDRFFGVCGSAIVFGDVQVRSFFCRSAIAVLGSGECDRCWDVRGRSLLRIRGEGAIVFRE